MVRWYINDKKDMMKGSDLEMKRVIYLKNWNKPKSKSFICKFCKSEVRVSKRGNWSHSCPGSFKILRKLEDEYKARSRVEKDVCAGKIWERENDQIFAHPKWSTIRRVI